jgi:peroxiredoxin
MKHRSKSKHILILLVFSFTVILFTAYAEAKMFAQATEKKYSTDKAGLPEFQLPVPQSDTERKYLGLPAGKKTFKVNDIKARIVIIEVFSFYCPICQPQAALVNELYNKIQSRPDLKDTVKMIGIAATNTPFEAQSFKETHRVPFPVFPDEDSNVAITLDIKYTPTFIGVKLDGKGSAQQFYWRPGAFKDSSQVLQEILQASGLDLK